MDVIMGKQNEKNKYMIFFIFGSMVLLAGVIFTLAANKNIIPSFAPTGTPTPSPSPILNFIDTPTSTPGPTKVPDVTELKVEDIKLGTGPEAASGSSVTVNYIGRLTDGKIFDTSLQQGRKPFEFTVGGGQVIKGWDEGLLGMKVGGQRRLIIPPDKGYGVQGAAGVIPPNATLIFEIELLGVK